MALEDDQIKKARETFFEHLQVANAHLSGGQSSVFGLRFVLSPDFVLRNLQFVSDRELLKDLRSGSASAPNINGRWREFSGLVGVYSSTMADELLKHFSDEELLEAIRVAKRQVEFWVSAEQERYRSQLIDSNACGKSFFDGIYKFNSFEDFYDSAGALVRDEDILKRLRTEVARYNQTSLGYAFAQCADEDLLAAIRIQRRSPRIVFALRKHRILPSGKLLIEVKREGEFVGALSSLVIKASSLGKLKVKDHALFAVHEGESFSFSFTGVPRTLTVSGQRPDEAGLVTVITPVGSMWALKGFEVSYREMRKDEWLKFANGDFEASSPTSGDLDDPGYDPRYYLTNGRYAPDEYYSHPGHNDSLWKDPTIRDMYGNDYDTYESNWPD